MWSTERMNLNRQKLLGAGLAFVVSLANYSFADARPRLDANGNAAQVIGHRPSGCPRAWCGCGLARYLGLRDRRLWLAWNWQKLFPRTSGHAGAVGVLRHHVLLVEQHISGTRYLVRDFNGGRGLAWLHVRDLRGFVFVNPNARSASL